MHCRPGTVTSSEPASVQPATIPDQRCTTSCCTASGKRKPLLRLRRHFLGGAGPAVMGQVKHHAVGVAKFCLVERIRRGRPARKIGAAGLRDLLLRFVEIIDPHAEVIEARLLVALVLSSATFITPSDI